MWILRLNSYSLINIETGVIICVGDENKSIRLTKDFPNLEISKKYWSNAIEDYDYDDAGTIYQDSITEIIYTGDSAVDNFQRIIDKLKSLNQLIEM